MSAPQDIRAIILDRMLAVRMRPSELASRAGLGSQTVRNFLAGRNELGHRKLERILAELNLDLGRMWEK